MDGYKLGGKISVGTFGAVFVGTNIETGEKVAIKTIRARRPIPGLNVDPWSRSAEREFEVLSRVRHQHIMRLLDHSAVEGSFALVYELLSWDVQALVERHKPLAEAEAKLVMQMLLTGLDYLHSLEVMHRDIKPSNLLLEAVSGTLKIADFGSARFCPNANDMPALAEPHNADLEQDVLAESEPGGLTRDVCSRWYKSPEMLFGSMDYGLSVDLWATGCVLGFLLSSTATSLFEGQSDIDQLCCIFKLRGTPREADWPEVKMLPDYNKIEFTPCGPLPFVFQGGASSFSSASVDLLEALLQLNPANRVRAEQALRGQYFHTAPLAAPRQALAQYLGEPGEEHLAPEDFGSDGSDFASPDWEFESIPIETTSCGLWDGAVSAGSDDATTASLAEAVATAVPPVVPAVPPAVAAPTAKARHSTPPPPQSGGHRFKPGVF